MKRLTAVVVALAAVVVALLGIQHRQSQQLAAECSVEAVESEVECRGAPLVEDLPDSDDETGDQRALRCMAVRDEVYVACLQRGAP
jgi:hypothetical protein